MISAPESALVRLSGPFSAASPPANASQCVLGFASLPSAPSVPRLLLHVPTNGSRYAAELPPAAEMPRPGCWCRCRCRRHKFGTSPLRKGHAARPSLTLLSLLTTTTSAQALNHGCHQED